MELLSFGGSQLFRPGAYSVVNVKTNTPHQPGAFKILAVIGSGIAGQPGVPLYFNSPTLAAQRIGGTDALLQAQIAWDHGADLICFVLTDQATQATYDVQSTDATPVTLLTLNGLRWNTADNNLQITVGAPANGSQTITITDTSVSPNVVETYTLADTAAGITNVINQINTQSNLVSATAGTSATTTNTAATVSTAVSFTGGTRTAGTTTQITNAINALQTEDIQGVLTTLTDSTSQTAIFNHCNTLSDVENRKERRAFLGQAVGTTVSAYASAMNAFGSSNRATLVAPGLYRAVNGQKTLLSSAFTAAAVAGDWAGKANPNSPVTFDYINALGMEFAYLDADIKTLVQAQVTVIETVPRRGYRIVRGLTSDQTGTNLVELSVADLVDVMNRSVREQVEDRFIGKAGYPGVVNDVQQFVTTILDSFKKQNWIVDGTDQFGQPLPAYRNVSVTQNTASGSQTGAQFNVTYEIAPCLPINYVTMTATANV